MNKIFQQIAKFLDWLKTNTDCIKIIIIVVAVFLVISGGFFGGCKQKQVCKLLEKISKLNTDTDNFQDKIKEDRLIIGALENQKTILRQRVKGLENIKDILQGREDSLNAILATISPIIDKIPSDSSYKFLQAVYSFKNEIKPYKFNSEQVKAIHKDKLKSYILFDINKILRNQVLNCEANIIVLKDINETSENQLKICKGINIDFEKVVENKDKELKIKNKQLKKAENKGKFWQICTGIAGGLAILIAL